MKAKMLIMIGSYSCPGMLQSRVKKFFLLKKYCIFNLESYFYKSIFLLIIKNYDEETTYYRKSM